MSERLGVDVWYRGLGEGWSIKDAFDQNRGAFESLGETWPYAQVGIPRVRVAGQLVLPMYVGYRLQADPPRTNSGPIEYIPLYAAIWKSFNTAGSQVHLPPRKVGLFASSIHLTDAGFWTSWCFV
jgi:hypothetical protein